jgi:hypothetical protein
VKKRSLKPLTALCEHQLTRVTGGWVSIHMKKIVPEHPRELTEQPG